MHREWKKPTLLGTARSCNHQWNAEALSEATTNDAFAGIHT